MSEISRRGGELKEESSFESSLFSPIPSPHHPCLIRDSTSVHHVSLGRTYRESSVALAGVVPVVALDLETVQLRRRRGITEYSAGL